MANDRMYLKCKGCGAITCIAKCFSDGYYFATDNNHAAANLLAFWAKHAYCGNGPAHQDFELIYESQDIETYRKEEHPAEYDNYDDFLDK